MIQRWRFVTGQQKVFLDALALFGLLGLGIEQTDDAIGIVQVFVAGSSAAA